MNALYVDAYVGVAGDSFADPRRLRRTRASPASWPDRIVAMAANRHSRWARQRRCSNMIGDE